MYVKFFRWATDRLGDRNGIVCFVSNNSFIDQHAFDGMRKHLAHDFQKIDHIDLHGNVRRNPKLSGTTHNVFGIQVGVGITLAIKKRGADRTVRYHRVPEMWRKREKLDFLIKRKIPWNAIAPDMQHSWLIPEHADEYRGSPSLSDIFGLYSVGVKTNRDEVVYDWNRDKLSERIERFISDYNAEAHRHKADPDAEWPDRLKWSRGLKQDAVRGRLVDKDFGTLASDTILPLHLAFEKVQCFPLSHLKDGAVSQFRQHYSDDAITNEDVFHYIYAVLHHSGYRERYAENLKRELPRIPFAADFHGFATAGRELARLHVDYESLEPWPLEYIERKDVPFSERVAKMKLSKDRMSLQVNDSLTLAGLPREVFEYRLGSKSALEWIIDQYQVKGDSDPNREDDPGYIVRLVGQVVRVSVETVRIVNSLAEFRVLSLVSST
jgi:predicted helicase